MNYSFNYNNKKYFIYITEGPIIGTMYYTIDDYPKMYQAYQRPFDKLLYWNSWYHVPDEGLKKVIEKYIKHLVFA